MDETTQDERVMSRWRRIALPVSVVLNLFLIALIGGHFLHRPIPAAGSEGPLARALANMEASLSQQDSLVDALSKIAATAFRP
jgi:uncharacterized membrane protein